jgi:dynein assembly factor with WDR repeat domains 1
LEYRQKSKNNIVQYKNIDLLNLSSKTVLNELADSIIANEPLISESKKARVITLLEKLQNKVTSDDISNDFFLFKVLKGHILPLTNCAFNKNGDTFITGSYDRTCKVWDTISGDELLSLEGHKNVVYAISFNKPFGDKIITGSFDKTCKLWDAKSGENLHTFRGHDAEIVCVAFDPKGITVGTGSMDNTARLYDTETGHCLHTLIGHTGEVVALDFDSTGRQIATGSFDHTVKIWDKRSGKNAHTFRGHRSEISSTRFDFSVSVEEEEDIQNE